MPEPDPKLPVRESNAMSPDDLSAERAFIRSVIRSEAEAVGAIADRIGAEFHAAVDLVERCAGSGGTVLVSGLGKSGLIGGKISATFSSLGIPSHCVHPTEAAHGDLGRFRRSDTAVCLSHSGETEEVVGLAAILRQDGIPVIAISRGHPTTEDRSVSSLERLATVTLATGVDTEAGSDSFLAPTSSTTATLAIGDALALAVARRREFSFADFAKRHPGGQLGGMLRPVEELLRFRAGENLPLMDPSMSVGEALRVAADQHRRPGAMLVADPGSGRLLGIFTDGDLRRLILRDPGELRRPLRAVMTPDPRTLHAGELARDAVRMFREHRQDEIPVIDGEGRPVGLLDVQDLITMKLVRD